MYRLRNLVRCASRTLVRSGLSRPARGTPSSPSSLRSPDPLARQRAILRLLIPHDDPMQVAARLLGTPTGP